jgi:hypothetical protein
LYRDKIKFYQEVFKMKRLVLLVIGLVFLFTTSVFAQAPAAKPGEPAKPAVAAEKKADAKAVDVKAAPAKDTKTGARTGTRTCTGKEITKFQHFSL